MALTFNNLTSKINPKYSKINEGYQAFQSESFNSKDSFVKQSKNKNIASANKVSFKGTGTRGEVPPGHWFKCYTSGGMYAGHGTWGEIGNLTEKELIEMGVEYDPSYFPMPKDDTLVNDNRTTLNKPTEKKAESEIKKQDIPQQVATKASVVDQALKRIEELTEELEKLKNILKQ